jgi:hypothetical protein
MTGQIDEVCFYNRSLSQNEIRELMHLTKNRPSADPSLKTYYQFNEVGGSIIDRTGNNVNATFQGTSARVISSAPVGTGMSERQTITTTGVKTFVNEGVALTFGAGTLPNGEICVTRLNAQPDSVPASGTFSNTSSRYWIINNYGTNSTFTSPVNMTLTGFGNISTDDATNPNYYKLHRRNTGDYLDSGWALIDSASSATTGINGSLGFTGTNNTVFNKQFTIVKVTPPFRTLNIIAFLEALYTGVSNMNAARDENGPHFGPAIADKINIELHDVTNYSNIIYTAPNVSLGTNGYATTSIPAVFNGSYYITIKHRNSIETCTASPVNFSGNPISYNFTTAASRAHGDNQKNLGDGNFGIYAGDVDQDGGIGIYDMGFVENASNVFAAGYLPEDIDGDGLVGIYDMGFIENNSNAFVGVSLP